MKKQLFLPVLAIIGVCITSCNPEPNPIDFPKSEGFKRGVWVSNEGAFLKSNGEVSWILTDSTLVENNVYSNANSGLVLGDVVQSIAHVSDKTVIVVNNSKKVEVVDTKTGLRVGTITQGLTYPRHAIAHPNGSTFFVSNGSVEGKVLGFDLITGFPTASFPVGKGPEKMVVSNNRLFVTNSGGFDVDSTVSIINLTTETLEKTLVVGDIPTDIDVDNQGNIWVICRGKAIYDPVTFEEIDATSSKIVKINGISLEIEATYIVGDKFDHASQIEVENIEDGVFYILKGSVYQAFPNGTSLQASKWIENGSYAAIGINSKGEVFVAESSNYVNASAVIAYSKLKAAIGVFAVGIAPNGFAFVEE